MSVSRDVDRPSVLAGGQSVDSFHRLPTPYRCLDLPRASGFLHHHTKLKSGILPCIFYNRSDASIRETQLNLWWIDWYRIAVRRDGHLPQEMARFIDGALEISGLDFSSALLLAFYQHQPI